MIRHNPAWVALLTAWKVVAFILGLSVVGCGVAQLIKRKEKQQYQSGVRVNWAPRKTRATI